MKCHKYRSPFRLKCTKLQLCIRFLSTDWRGKPPSFDKFNLTFGLFAFQMGLSFDFFHPTKNSRDSIRYKCKLLIKRIWVGLLTIEFIPDRKYYCFILRSGVVDLLIIYNVCILDSGVIWVQVTLGRIIHMNFWSA